MREGQFALIGFQNSFDFKIPQSHRISQIAAPMPAPQKTQGALRYPTEIETSARRMPPPNRRAVIPQKYSRIRKGSGSLDRDTAFTAFCEEEGRAYVSAVDGVETKNSLPFSCSLFLSVVRSIPKNGFKMITPVQLYHRTVSLQGIFGFLCSGLKKRNPPVKPGVLHMRA